MTHWTSQASVVQRRGRAGRCKPGLCFNLFSKEQFERMGMFPHVYCSKATVSSTIERFHVHGQQTGKIIQVFIEELNSNRIGLVK